MRELKACSHCGCRADYDPEFHDPRYQRVMCKNDRCPSSDLRMSKEEWNTRPLEDELRGLLEDWMKWAGKAGYSHIDIAERTREVLGK